MIYIRPIRFTHDVVSLNPVVSSDECLWVMLIKYEGVADDVNANTLMPKSMSTKSRRYLGLKNVYLNMRPSIGFNTKVLGFF